MTEVYGFKCVFWGPIIIHFLVDTILGENWIEPVRTERIRSLRKTWIHIR